MKAQKQKKPPQDAQTPRSQARMAAVQGLYQMDLAGTDVTDVIDQFETLRFAPVKQKALADGEEPTADLSNADATFFAEILRGVVRRQRDIDPMVDEQLAHGWRLVRVDSILRAILRAGVFELMERIDVPPRVAINEYINVAHAFFDEDEPRVVNGVLDKIGRKLRPDAFAAKPGSD
jgi:transcription antitermination protein NusB